MCKRYDYTRQPVAQGLTESHANLPQIFKIVLAKAFDLKCTIPEIENIGEPLLLYKNV
jgi:GTP-binding protein of the ras superfamily involved in termination of M-phase